MTATTTIRLLDPRSFPDDHIPGAAPVADLRGLEVGFLWNNRPKGDLILRQLAGMLEQRHGTRSLFTNKLRVGTGAGPEVINAIVAEAQAAIVGVGD